MNKPICALAAGVLFALSANAGEWYVDSHSKVTPATGTSEAPFTTIEAAVQAASDEDRIWVRPGEYVSDDAGYDSENDIKAVACLTKKVRLESTEGKEKTFIIGKFDNGGPGPNAVSCVWATKAGTVVKGFTIKGGASRTNGNSGNISQNHGGGISYLNGSGKRDCYVVDCTVRDCKATRGGGAAFCTVMQTLFVNNTTTSGHGQAARHSNLYACIFIGNSAFADNGDYSAGANHAAADAASYVVNCTFVGNPAGGLEGGSAINISVANTVSTFSIGTPAPACESFYVNSDLKTTVSHCVFDGVRFQNGADNFSFADSVTNASPYQTISPFEGDFRIVKGGDCDGTGDPAAVNCTWVPEEFRGKDFYGNPLVVDGKCNVGAVAASAERKGGILVVKGESANGAIVNGNGDYRNKVLYNMAAGIYVGSATWPRQVYVTAGEKQNGRPAIRFEMSGYGSVADNAAPSRFTDYDGGAWFMLPRDTTRVFTGTIKYAAGIKYVNAATGVDDDESGRGDSDEMPYKTIQKAHDKSATDWLVLAAPGDYKDGETVVNSVTTRVYITKSVLIRASDRTARDRTIIRGYRMPDKRDWFENGHIRPLRMWSGIHCAVQGFTITEGCTIANENSEPGSGGLVYGNGVKTQLLDCLLSDGRGSRAGAVQGVWAIRCVFTNNTCTGGQCTARDATVSSCIFTENYNSSSWEVGVNTRVFNCSQYSSMMTGSDNTVAGCSAYIYNSIFTGGVYGDPIWEKNYASSA